jgi:hypothetical protein
MRDRRNDGECPSLTRRYPKRQDCWHVYYGDVHAGTIAKRVGIPWDEQSWGCLWGFYPGSHPGECTNGTAATFDQARADFEAGWAVFLSNRTEVDFQEWRDQRNWTARKYALWDAGKRLEPPSYGPGKPAHRFRRCPCSQVFDMHGPDEVLVHVPHITARSNIQGRYETERTGESSR